MSEFQKHLETTSCSSLNVPVPPGKYNVTRVAISTNCVAVFAFPDGLAPGAARVLADEMRELLAIVEKWAER